MILDLFIPDAGSLKSKRFVLKSLKDRLKKKFNISVAEQSNNLWQRVSLFIACVSSDSQHLNSTLEGVKNMVEREHDLEIIDFTIELL